jgi:hypothetical protein
VTGCCVCLCNLSHKLEAGKEKEKKKVRRGEMDLIQSFQQAPHQESKAQLPIFATRERMAHSCNCRFRSLQDNMRYSTSGIQWYLRAENSFYE